MKALFRYLTSEINGFYLAGLHNFLNSYTEYLKPYMAYMDRVQFKTEDEDISGSEIPMSDDDIRGIGRIAGVVNPLISAESNTGSILFTTSKIVDGVEYSERGLYDVETESFKFFRTNGGTYTDDIVTLANAALKSSLVPHGTPIFGYIADGTDVLTEDGQIIEANILADPPVGVAYYPWYGPEYLFLAENFIIEAFLDIETYKKLFEVYQKIRYNGASIKTLAEITEVIMEDYAQDIYFESNGVYILMYYTLNIESELQDKLKRLYAWLAVLAEKFKQIVPQEVV